MDYQKKNSSEGAIRITTHDQKNYLLSQEVNKFLPRKGVKKPKKVNAQADNKHHHYHRTKKHNTPKKFVIEVISVTCKKKKKCEYKKITLKIENLKAFLWTSEIRQHRIIQHYNRGPSQNIRKVII